MIFMSRKISTFIFTVIFILCSAAMLSASAENSSSIDVAINGEILEFDVPPFIENDRTLIPVRAVSEYLKYDVTWHDEDKCVEITDGSDTFNLYIGNSEYIKNSQTMTMDTPANIKDGRTFVPLRLIAEEFGCEVNWIAEISMVEIVKYNIIEADTPQDIVSNIGNYTKIILKDKEYNLSELDSSYIPSDYISKEELYKGYDYIMKDLTHFSIEAADNASPSIVTESSYANVLCFKDCQGIQLKNLTVGHKAEKGYCTGGVVYFENCAVINVDNCHLYGCGTYGISTLNSADISVTNTEIYECSYGLIDLDASTSITFDNCIFRDSQMFSMFDFLDCTDICISNSVISDNTSDNCALIDAYNSENITFVNCDFKNNTYNQLSKSESITLTGCNITN